MTENPLGYEKISKLLKHFAIPSIVAALVGSIYNIVDQIFIGQGVGYLGNAATNVAYPFSTICLAIALLVGIGSASRVSLCLGAKEPKIAAKAAGGRSVNDPSQSLQMIERPLMTADELKSMPKGQFIVMKTGVYPMKVKLQLFFKYTAY